MSPGPSRGRRRSGSRARPPLVGLSLALLAVLVLAGCGGGWGDPGPSPSPTADDSSEVVAAAVSPGESSTAEASYRLADLELPDLASPVEVEGHVVGPVGVQGALPMVVLLHGYNGSCWSPDTGDSTGDWPCPKGFEPIPHALGLTYMQERLASQGYLAVSLSANGVNVLASDMGEGAGAPERAALVAHHLDAWAAGEVPGMERWPDVDTGSVVLVGHSRGGEGVDRAVAERPASAAWRVRGELLIAPTAFKPPERSAVPVVTLTGYCDGDVGPFSPQRYVDRPADPAVLRSSMLLDGANHNFFNSEWVPGSSTVPGGADDAFNEAGVADSRCEPDAPTRLTAAEQQEVAARVVGLAAAAFLRGERAAADVLDGRSPVPMARSEDLRVSAVGRGRTTVTRESGFSGAGEGSVVVSDCVGISETEEPHTCGGTTGEGVSVHWPGEWRDPPRTPYSQLEWAEAGGTARLDLQAPLDLSGAAGIDARVAVVPEGPDVSFDVVLTDAAGATAGLGGAQALDPWPEGDQLPSRRWGQRLFVPVPSDVPLDRAAITAITLIPTSAPGHAWIIDVSALPESPA